MTGNFIANLAFIIFINFLVKPASLLVEASVQNSVGAQTYGMYSAIFNFSTLFYIILDMGITNFNNRSVAQDSAHLERYLPGILILKLMLAVLYIGITYTTATIMGYPAQQMYLLVFMMMNQVLLSSILYFRSNISGLHFFKLDSILSALDKLLLLGIVSTLLWARFMPKPFDIRWFAYAQTVSLGTTAIVALSFVFAKAGKIRFKWTWADIGHMLKSTYPYAMLGILMTVYYRIDSVMIERMIPVTGDYENGIYAASFRFLDAANNVGLLFAALLLPMFARMISKKQPLEGLLKTGFKLLFTGSLIVMATAWFYRQQVVQLIYRQANDGTQYWGNIFGILFLAYGAVCTMYIYGSLLTANGNMRVLNSIALAGCVLNIALNLLLIPHYKALGSAFATLITQWLVAAAHVIAAHRKFKLETDFTLASRIGSFIGGLIIVELLIKHLPVNWTIGLFFSCFIAVVFAMILRLFDVQEALAVVRNRASGNNPN